MHMFSSFSMKITLDGSKSAVYILPSSWIRYLLKLMSASVNFFIYFVLKDYERKNVDFSKDKNEMNILVFSFIFLNYTTV